MANYIDRQAALNALGERPMSWTDSEYELGSVNRYDIDRLAIETVPPADVQPVQHGHWIESDADGFVCSVCRNGYKNQPTLMGEPMFEYCPVCGARMDGEKNG